MTVATIRQAIASKIAAITPVASETWWEAPVPYDGFGVAAVPDAVPATKAHGAFAVGVPSTPRYDQRQRPQTNGTLAQTTVMVRFLARATPPATGTAVASFDAACNMEHAVIKALMYQSPTFLGDASIRLEATPTRSTPAPGNWHAFEIQFTVFHPFDLA